MAVRVGRHLIGENPYEQLILEKKRFEQRRKYRVRKVKNNNDVTPYPIE